MTQTAFALTPDNLRQTPQPTLTPASGWPLFDFPELPEFGATATPQPTATPMPVIGRLATTGNEGKSWHWFQMIPPQSTSLWQYGYFDPNAKGIGQITGNMPLDVLETANAEHWFRVAIRGYMETADFDSNWAIAGVCHSWGHPTTDEICHAHLFGSFDRMDIIGQIQSGTPYSILSRTDDEQQMLFVEIRGWLYVDQIVSFQRQPIIRCGIEIVCENREYLPLIENNK
jgi:hypothetical protein